MEQAFAAVVDRLTPKMNEEITNGLARKHMSQAENYVSSIFTSVSKEFPEGLVYEGWSRCTPQEEVAEETRKRGSKSVVDVARHDFFLVKFKFSYKGELLKDLFVYLPYVTRHNTIHIGSSRFLVSPVLNDPTISVTMNMIFVRLLRAKVKFERIDYFVKINGHHECCQIVYSGLHNRSEKMRAMVATVKIKSSLAHYLFGKFGVRQTFVKYAGVNPIFGNAEINSVTYPSDDWVIVESSGSEMKRRVDPYPKSPIRIAIKKSEFTPLVQSLCAGFFYIVDHFPTHHIDVGHLDQPREVNLWRILLGSIIWSGNEPHGRLLSNVENHYASLNNYIDNLINEKFRDAGLFFEDFYALLAVMLEKYHTWLLDGEANINSMYDKELNIIYYMLYDLSAAIFKTNFTLTSMANKELTAKLIEEVMRKRIATRLLRRISKTCGCLSTESTPGDNPVFKLTTILVPQTSAIRDNKAKGGAKNNSIDDPAKQLHVSVAEFGGYANMPKSEPSGRERLNQFPALDSRNMLVRHEKYRALLDETQALLSASGRPLRITTS